MSPDRLKRLTIVLLAVGFTAAIVIYFTADPRPENPLGYEPLETKKYIHDLELYGGKANVLAAQFNDWFFGLWYGRNLAFTVAVITVLLALFVRFLYAPIVRESHLQQMLRNQKPYPLRYLKTKGENEKTPEGPHLRIRKRN